MQGDAAPAVYLVAEARGDGTKEGTLKGTLIARLGGAGQCFDVQGITFDRDMKMRNERQLLMIA